MPPAKTDRNHQEIVNEFRRLGATVFSLHAVGKGIPDILVGYNGHNILVEIKDGNKPPSQRKLTPQQSKFFSQWKGTAFVVANLKDVSSLINQLSRC